MAEEPHTNEEQPQPPPETTPADPAPPPDLEDSAPTPSETELPATDAAEPVEQAAAENAAAADAFPEASSDPAQPTEDAAPPEPSDDVEAEMAALLEQAASADDSASPAPTDGVEAEMAALLQQSEQDAASETNDNSGAATTAPPAADAPNPAAAAEPFDVPDFNETTGDGELGQIDLLDDVELEVKIELGRTEMYIEDVIQLGVGAVIELDKLAGDPVDIYVNERLVARGEVLVLNDNFCVRVNDILSPVPELEHAP